MGWWGVSAPPTKRKELSYSWAPYGQTGGAAEQCPLFPASKMGEKQQGQGGGGHWIERPLLVGRPGGQDSQGI